MSSRGVFVFVFPAETEVWDLGDYTPNWPILAIPIGKIMIDNGMLHDVWGTLFSDKPIFVQPRQPLFKRFYHCVPLNVEFQLYHTVIYDYIS